MALLALALGTVVAGCGASDEDHIRVFAASSLTDVFTEMIEQFAAANEGADPSIELIVAGSSALVAQINEGAPADVVATASSETMDLVTGSPTRSTFARNSLVIATEQGNPHDISDLQDLTSDDLLVAVCAPQVPCGTLAVELLDDAEVALDPATFEPNVRSVATKVGLGEVDAGLIYRTDVDSAPVDAVEIGQSDRFATAYPIAALSTSPEALSFIDFVLSEQGSEILARAGFLPPP
ncbi:MAG: molybdate ABC transporter substrate-binding protein [Acidimicrobiales bacterium]